MKQENLRRFKTAATIIKMLLSDDPGPNARPAGEAFLSWVEDGCPSAPRR